MEKSIKIETGTEELRLSPSLAERLSEFLASQEQRLTPLEDWLTGSVVTDMLDISERTLLTLRSNGTLPYSRIGNKLYYRRSDIEALLDRASTDCLSRKEVHHD